MRSKRWLLLVSLLTLCLTPPSAFADGVPQPPAEEGAQANDLFSMDLEKLLDVKVTTASKFSERLSDAPGVMSVVTKDELRRFGGLTLGEILDRVAGLTLTTASFTDRSMVAARGDQTKINGGHILILINGRPTREVLEGGIISDLLESFPVNILERIEVIKGPGSVLYGSNAFSAVINLITQKATGNELVVTGLGAKEEGAATSGQLMLKRGNLSVVGAGQFHQQPDWVTPVSTTYFGVQNASIPDRGEGAYLGVDYKGLSFMSAFTDLGTSYIEGGVGNALWKRGFGDLGYHLKATNKWDMTFNLTYTRTTLDAADSIPFITRDSHEAVLEWTNVVTLTDKDKLTFGALFNHIQGSETFLGSMVISQGSRDGEGFYAQLDHKLRDNVKLIGGFQANKIGDLKLNVVPRGGVIWNPASRFSVKALYSEAFRAPSINENHMDYVPPPTIGGPSLIGNPNLAPEKVATLDVGLFYQGNRLQAGVDYFHSKLTDSIVEANVTAAGGYVNLGEALFQGFELEGKYYLKKDFFLMGSTLYQANHDGSGAKNITPIPNFGAKSGIGYESANGLTASLFDVYENGQEGYAHAVNPQPHAYHFLNSQLRYDLSRYLHAGRAGVALVAHGENLMNKAVWLPDWQDTPGDTIFVNRGRTVYVGV